jgi:hypothetical protein
MAKCISLSVDSTHIHLLPKFWDFHCVVLKQTFVSSPVTLRFVKNLGRLFLRLPNLVFPILGWTPLTGRGAGPSQHNTERREPPCGTPEILHSNIRKHVRRRIAVCHCLHLPFRGCVLFGKGGSFCSVCIHMRTSLHCHQECGAYQFATGRLFQNNFYLGNPVLCCVC